MMFVFESSASAITAAHWNGRLKEHKILINFHFRFWEKDFGGLWNAEQSLSWWCYAQNTNLWMVLKSNLVPSNQYNPSSANIKLWKNGKTTGHCSVKGPLPKSSCMYKYNGQLCRPSHLSTMMDTVAEYFWFMCWLGSLATVTDGS